MKTDIFELYEKGTDHHTKISLYSDTEKCINFYEDRQWVGLENNGEEMPFYNFIKPVVKYKTSSISMNDMTIIYSSMSKSEEEAEICEYLNKQAAKLWEQMKMSSTCWKLVSRANKVGDAYLYFYDFDKKPKVKLINNINVYLSDENTTDIQNQEYILISERMTLKAVKTLAKEYKVSEAELNQIQPDSKESWETQEEVSDKVTVILKMWKEKGSLWFTRSTKDTIIQPKQEIKGAKEYPLVNLVIEPLENSSRGLGEIKPLIPNQIEVNKTLYRRSKAIQNAAFPKIAYNEDLLSNAEALNQVGAQLAIKGLNANRINDIVGYLQPVPLSSNAKELNDEIRITTKDLAGAGDAALGQIDPTQASGTAIKITRDQASIPLNESIASYRQTIEDIAKVWLDLWRVYNPNGLIVETEEDTVIIPQEDLDRIDVNIKVDVSAKDPFSLYAYEATLSNYLSNKLISFEEFVELLNEGSIVPKNKLEQLIERRQLNAMQQMSSGIANNGLQIPNQGPTALLGSSSQMPQ